MSYSAELKSSIASQDIKSKCCAAAELCALIMMHGKNIFKYDNESFVRRISILATKASEFYGAGVVARKEERGKPFYSIEILEKNFYEIDNIKNKFCCSDAFLRGCFLYSGYISAPDKPARAEISFRNKEPFEICKYQLEQSGIKFNVTTRSNKDIIYIKSIEGVSDFLARIGAVGAMLQFENTIILKNYKSQANRAANCDNANLDKAVSAALRQTAILKDFMKTASFDALPVELKEIAVLRVENESLSLKELGALMTPVLSKSGVAHRLKRLEEAAAKSV